MNDSKLIADKRNKIVLKGQGIKDSDNIFKDLSDNQFKSLYELDLSDNNLTQLPQDLKVFDNLHVLDITNNPFESFEQIAKSLSTLPVLIDLKINLSDQKEAILILNNIPNLQFLNGKSTKDDSHVIDIEDKEIESISLNDEITNFNVIFSKISEKINLINKEKTQEYLEQFQSILKREITKINTAVDNAVPNYIYASNVLSSKITIFKYFEDKYLEYLDIHDPETAKMIREFSDNMTKSSNFLTNIIFNLYPRIEEKSTNMKKELDDALKSIKILEDQNSSLQEKINLSNKEKEFLNSQYNDEKNIYLEKIEMLEKENKIMTDKLIKNAKNMIGGSGNQPSTNINEKKDENLNREGNSNINETMNKGKIGNNIIVGPNGSRVLTVKMMKDIINEIYSSKADFDKKCMENKLPKETMEQHMYTFLNQKYGLKTLIIEWATSIVNGIKMYSLEDSDICLFGKILRNELDEDSIFIMQKLKQTINDLLNHCLKNIYRMKSNSEIKEQYNQRINGFILEDEWKFIIKHVYDEQDSEYLENKITDIIRKKINASKTMEAATKKLTRDELLNLTKNKEELKIPFKDFQKILLDHHIKSKDRYLKNFVILFKKCDTDNNGIIDENEFVNILGSTNVYGEQLEEQTYRLLSIIDPNNNKQITFSECVSLFSQEFIEGDENGEVSLLDKICLEDNNNQ